MEHSTEFLVLAAHVRDLAAKLRQSKLEEEMRNWALMNPEPREKTPIAYTQEDQKAQQTERTTIAQWDVQRAQHRSAWLRSNPVSGWAKEALGLILETADALKQP